MITETATAMESSGGTLRERVVRELRREIEGGLWPPGAKLPSMSVLCGRYGVSNITVRSALRELTQCGLVESRPRSGIYVRSAKTGGFAGGKRPIGLIVTGNRNSLYAELITGVEAVCSAHDYELSVAISNDDPRIEAEQIARLGQRSAGLLITPNMGEFQQSAYRTLRNVPCVQLVRYGSGFTAPSVVADNQVGGYLATRHLCEVGCDTVYLLSDYDDSAARERRAGYEAALEEAGLRQCAFLHQREHGEHAESGEAVGYHLMQRALDENALRGGRKVGVFALNLQLARGCYLALKEAQLAIPRDAAVVGFDDVGAEFFDPPLTTVRQDIAGMGRCGAELLLKLVDGRGSQGAAHEPPSVRLQPELIVRNSTDAASAYCLKKSMMTLSAPLPVAEGVGST